ncbi:hypothetical protein CPB84DRAFT_1797148 [Gymnopilus junonius]|uniref:U6 small nuclear RNA (adenine-(43)-N(6))-methyltransferase n=1 Tax=Gymnopilus junonius TaxID=109634 RepID=A0A9P5NA61_GYMJU|nr:hypothetical protein CPB84DRAFT_1797148 [Gymnopilus junonius]
MNYVLWIQDIVYAHQTILGVSSRRIRGLDIGTGATAIYPILACKTEQSWEMVVTELDDYSYECACDNVSSNNMQTSIKVKKASVDGPILFPVENQNFDFSMCNPPFYGSKEEVAQSAESKELPPNAVCTGAEIEMIFSQGGEEGFVGRMVEESERLQTRCKWYTSMLGKMSSVSTIVQALRARSIMNYAITEFVQGQTRRWAIAWSFSDTHLPDAVSRISSNTLSQPFPSFSPSEVENALFEVLQAIPGSENTWSRSARRGNQNRKVGDRDQASVSAKDRSQILKPALACSCRVDCVPQEVDDDGGVLCSMESQWIYGSDRGLFESFVGHVGRKVSAALKTKMV